MIFRLVALVSFTTSGMNDDKLVDDIVSIGNFILVLSKLKNYQIIYISIKFHDI